MRNKLLLSFSLPLVIVAAWFIASQSELFPTAILPTPSAVVASFISQLQSGQLFIDLGVSLLRVVEGYALGAVLGILFGIALGMNQTINQCVGPTITAIRQIPIIAWIPFIILWCGIGEGSKVVIIAMASFFPIFVNTLYGIQGTKKEYLELAKVYRLSTIETFRKIYLKSALPSMFIGLKIGLSASWMAVIAAELIAANSGIGYRISDARSLMQPDVVLIGMIVIGFAGLLMDKLLTFAAKKATPWH